MSCAPFARTPAADGLGIEAAIVALSRLLQRAPDLDDPVARLALYDAHGVPTETIVACDAAAVKRARLWRDRIKPVAA